MPLQPCRLCALVVKIPRANASIRPRLHSKLVAARSIIVILASSCYDLIWLAVCPDLHAKGVNRQVFLARSCGLTRPLAQWRPCGAWLPFP